MILLACAVAEELAWWHPRDGVTVLVTGVGPVEAAAAVAHALASQRYKLVINAGIAGAYEGAARVGDGVVVSEERMEIDYESGAPLPLPGGLHTVETARSEPMLVEKLVHAGFPVLRGLTAPRVTTTESTARRLAALGVQTESMEGFAVLRAAQLAGISAIEVRGISNRAGAPDQRAWDWAAGIAGTKHVLLALMAILEAPAHAHPNAGP